MSMNGEDGRSGSIKYGGPRENVFECPQGPGRLYLSRVTNSKKTQRNKKSNKPAKKTQTETQKKHNQKKTTEILTIIREQTKRSEQKGSDTHGTS